jgi:hypothetical protein
MDDRAFQARRSFLLGAYLIYAPHIFAARKAHEILIAAPPHNPAGSLMLDSGEIVEWVYLNAPSAT